MYPEWTNTGSFSALNSYTRGTEMTVPGSVFIGHCVQKKQIMVGVCGEHPHTAIMSFQQALKLAAHIRSTVRRLSRLQGVDDDSEI